MSTDNGVLKSKTGTANSTINISGSLAYINNELDGLSFTPNSGYTGTTSIQITTDDYGYTGSGGSRTDTDILSVNVVPPPRVAAVSVTNQNGSYKIGDQLSVTIAFDQNIVVNISGGSPTLLLETGSVDRNATYVSNSTNSLTFRYIVQEGDTSNDLDYQSTAALSLNGATIQDSGHHDAWTILPAVGSVQSISGQKEIIIDGSYPTVVSVTVPTAGTYIRGNQLEFTVNWSETVTVDTTNGKPSIPITLDSGGTVNADFESGSGTVTIFRYTVKANDRDNNGITVISPIVLNGGVIRDTAENNAILTLNDVDGTTGVKVDAVAPTVILTDSDANNYLKPGDAVTITATFSKAMANSPSISISNVGITNVVMTDSGDHLTWTYIWTVPDDNTTAVVTVAGNDQPGNPYTGSDSITFTIDNQLLVVVFINPTSGNTFNVNTGSMVIVEVTEIVAGSGIDNGSVRVQVDGKDDDKWTVPTAITGNRVYYLLPASLTPGDHTIYVEVSDKAGNKTTQSVTFNWENYRKGFGFGRFRF